MYNVSSKICLTASPFMTVMSKLRAVAIQRLSAASEVTRMDGADG